MLFRLTVLPVICPHPLQTHRECTIRWSARLQPPALSSRPLAVPGNRSREEALTPRIALTQQCDNLLSPSVANTSPVKAELRRAAPPALLALQQVLINVCYSLDYLFFPDMLLTFFPSIQRGPEVVGSMCVLTAFTKGIVKKIKTL